MARQYPHASVVGVDLSPPPLEKSAIPPNLRFEIDDVNHGLAHFYNKFDFVHVRCVGTGIRNYPFLMDEVENCLNPGGLVIYMEGDVRILSHDQLHPVRFPGQNGQISWFRKLIYGEYLTLNEVVFLNIIFRSDRGLHDCWLVLQCWRGAHGQGAVGPPDV